LIKPAFLDTTEATLKQRVQQSFYGRESIRYRGNVSMEPFPSNDKGIFTEPLPSNEKGIFTEPWRNNMEGAFIDPLPRNDNEIHRHTHTHRQQRDLIILLYF
jgi:hypothetical protein